MTRELDTRDTVKTVTSNEFITAMGLEKLTLKARKLLYITISQCRKNDKGFYTYSIPAKEFARIMDVAPTNVYQEAFNITGELASAKISILPEGRKRFKHYPLVQMCEYTEDAIISIELNTKMTDFLLELQGDFTQPLLNDFVRMKSPYSMAIWHLMQREMHSKKPGITQIIQFDLSLEELRKVTGTENSFERLSDFKRYILNKALREIKDNCGVEISYCDIKAGRTVIGFRFTAISQYHVNENELPQHVKDKGDLIKLKNKAKVRELTPEEQCEYKRLTANAEQMSF